MGLSKYAKPGGWNDPDMLEVTHALSGPPATDLSRPSMRSAVLSRSLTCVPRAGRQPRSLRAGAPRSSPAAREASPPAERACAQRLMLPCCVAPPEQEQRANFALWAVLKSPLMVGTDLRALSSVALGILTAAEVIAVNQDKLGAAGDLVWKEGPLEVWPSTPSA